MIQHLLCGAAAAKHAGNERENGIAWAVPADSHAAPYAEDGPGTMHEGEANDLLTGTDTRAVNHAATRAFSPLLRSLNLEIQAPKTI